MTAGAKTVTVMVIHPNFKTVTVTVIFGKSILKNNKTAGNNFESNGTLHEFIVPGLIIELHYMCSVCLNELILTLHVGALILVLSIDVLKNYITFCSREGNNKKLHYISGPRRN